MANTLAAWFILPYGPAYSGQSGSVSYTLYDAAGNVVTPTAVSGPTELRDYNNSGSVPGTGSYKFQILVDPAWPAPLHAHGVFSGINGKIADAEVMSSPMGADGISLLSLFELLISEITAPRLDPIDNGDGTITINAYKQDGATLKFSVTFNKTTGARTAAVIH